MSKQLINAVSALYLNPFKGNFQQTNLLYKYTKIFDVLDCLYSSKTLADKMLNISSIGTMESGWQLVILARLQ